MTLDFLSIIPAFLLTTGTGLVSYIRKKDVERIEKIEVRVAQSVTEPQVRQVISDKIDPLKVNIREIKEDISEIKYKIDKLFDIHLKKYK